MKITKEAFNDLIQIQRDSQAENDTDAHPDSDEKWLATVVKGLGVVAKAFLERKDDEFLTKIVEVGALLQDWVVYRGFREDFYNLIQLERAAQDEKWGPQHHSDERWLAIVVEEMGEVSEAFQEKGDTEFLKEVTQVAALLQAWVTSRDFF